MCATSISQAKDDPAGYFLDQEIKALVHVARSDLAALQALPDSQRAVARRAVLFVLPNTVDVPTEAAQLELDARARACLLYTSDSADHAPRSILGARRLLHSKSNLQTVECIQG